MSATESLAAGPAAAEPVAAEPVAGPVVEPRAKTPSSGRHAIVHLSDETSPASVLAVRNPKPSPVWLRTVLTGWCFAMFFLSTVTLGVLALPILLLTRTDRASFTHTINARMRLFSGLFRDLGLVAHWPVQLPEGYEDRPVLVVANHPSLIDMILALGALPQMSCVASGARYKSRLMGAFLRRTDYIPGEGVAGDELAEGIAIIDRIESKLRSGVSVLVFPEGTRSAERKLRPFKRGAIEAAIRAEVPILPLFIGVSPAFLMKGQTFWHVPKTTARYDFEWFAPIETAGRGLNSKQVTRALQAIYTTRFERLLEERDALDAQLASAPA